MRSIKPGRGPSALSGIIGIFMIGFGIVWTVLASQISGIVALFGILWTGIAVVTTVYNFKNASQKNRYSTFDITDDREEPDPLNLKFGNTGITEEKQPDTVSRFCPYCGAEVGKDFQFCNNCGRKLP